MMKDLLIILSVMFCSQSALAVCPNMLSIGSPYHAIVDGKTATHEEMYKAREQTLEYISRAEKIIEECRLSDFQESAVIGYIEVAAERFNEQLRLYKLDQLGVAHNE